ncbi:Hypothetical protein SRAE_1000090800 [Strongyloides ratti]|uniref:Uncharacterized protein n=1 Tax=Strongyloides ratti TaxID=34506 RepID=A0A090MV47_STRRB|nr:Hypothetical protein SRAE_1000090800 [Strongyloides ratti]CEF62638.1 Hypothetical protein SRAE_1000090800 [Strongyloides ratti]
MAGKSDSNKNPDYPRQLIQVTKSNKSEDVVRTELRFVSYDLKTNLEQRFGSSEGSAVTQALWSLLTHLNKLNKDGDATEDDLLMQKQILEIQLEKARNNLENNEKYMREMMDMLKESEQIIKYDGNCLQPKYQKRGISIERSHHQQPRLNQPAEVKKRTKIITNKEEDIITTSSYIHPSICEVRNNENGIFNGVTNTQLNDKVSLSNSMCQALHDISKRVMSLQSSNSFNDPIFKSKVRNIQEMVNELKEIIIQSNNGSGNVSIKTLKNKFEVLTNALNNLYNQHLKNQAAFQNVNGGFTKKSFHQSTYYKN